MTAINYNIRIDQELRDEAFSVLDSYGLSPSQAIKLFLKQVAKTKSVPLSFDYQKDSDYSLTPKGEAMLRESIAEIERGDCTRMTFSEFSEWAKDNA